MLPPPSPPLCPRPLSSQGPYCSLCTIRDRSHYYSSSKSACLLCEGNLLLPILLMAGVFVALLALAGVYQRCKRRSPLRLQVMLAYLGKLCAQLSLRAKLKQLLAFCEHAQLFEPGTHLGHLQID